MVHESGTNSLYKKQAFTIESLAKSSRDESPKEDITPPRGEPLFRGINRSLEGITFGCIPQFSLTSPNLDRLTPVSDPGYKSLNSTPSKSEDVPSKRRRCSSGSDEAPNRAIPSNSSSTSDVSFDSISPYTSDTDACSDDQNRRKKARTAFSSEQVYGLEQRYQIQKYLPSSERSRLAKKLTLTDQQVKTWFQNRRMKEKRHQRDEEQARNFYLPTGGVDIAQLHAMGLPCPPPYKVQSPTVGHMFSSPSNNALPGYQFHSPVHMASSSNGQDRLQMHPSYLGYSPIMGSLPMFPRQSAISRHASSVPTPLTSTPVSKSPTYICETRGRSPA
ncbi:homeobox protein vent1-like [Mizuhopecten yessoensis]|uniref:Brain-specific homeobox protein-like n=1 Tax=Mizuhopecten yessoensis TaxID=6573 RepID=A0A210QQE5_MIZYE|nr:homeobox protein vent1-like [Mizuhopecten yessoensis]OWF50961.1 Brain-specific homeobox protein-like [Mizuhopecten yessoensis]